MTGRFRISLLSVLLLIVLRMSIGWHFFAEGFSKLWDPQWSSAGFLSQAKGPLAEEYWALVPDVHDWNEIMGKPREAAEELAAAEEDLQRWVEKILAAWGRIQVDASEHYGFDEEQSERARKAFEVRKNLLEAYVSDPELGEEVETYLHELKRLAGWQSELGGPEVPFQRKRIADKRRELNAQALEWQGWVREVEQGLVADLNSFATPEQRQSQGTWRPSPNSLQRMDTLTTYSLIAIGTCLLGGLFTRLASLGGAVFLASVILTQPPWIPDTVPVFYQVVECAALAFLATSPAGRWVGLDFFVHHLLIRPCCSTKGNT